MMECELLKSLLGALVKSFGSVRMKTSSMSLRCIGVISFILLLPSFTHVSRYENIPRHLGAAYVCKCLEKQRTSVNVAK
jgi:hypothetical protein